MSLVKAREPTDRLISIFVVDGTFGQVHPGIERLRIDGRLVRNVKARRTFCAERVRQVFSGSLAASDHVLQAELTLLGVQDGSYEGFRFDARSVHRLSSAQANVSEIFIYVAMDTTLPRLPGGFVALTLRWIERTPDSPPLQVLLERPRVPTGGMRASYVVTERTLRVEVAPGETYVYFDVPPEFAQRHKESSSKLLQELEKGRFRRERVK